MADRCILADGNLVQPVTPAVLSAGRLDPPSDLQVFA